MRRAHDRIVAVRTGSVEHATGFAASLLAVLCQIILLAPISLPPFAIGADPIGNAPICHADDETQPSQPPEKSITTVRCAFSAYRTHYLWPFWHQFRCFPNGNLWRRCSLPQHGRVRRQFASHSRHSRADHHH